MTVTQRIHAFNKGRDPKLCEWKFKRMKEGAFSLFRGSCHVFYEDLAKDISIGDSPKIWICGDLHLDNFGAYKGTDRKMHYDIEDFDEAIIAPVNWEIVRTVTSIYLAVRELPDGPNSHEDADDLAKDFVKKYRQFIRDGKPAGFESDVIQAFLDEETAGRKRKKLEELTNALEAMSDKMIVDKAIETAKKDIPEDGHVKETEPKTIVMEEDLKVRVKHIAGNWLKDNYYDTFKVLDAAHRIAGTGSLGLPRYIILVEDSRKEDPVARYFLLDMKQATPSCLGKFVNPPHEIADQDEAQRIIAIQNRMQKVGPSFFEMLPPIFRKVPFDDQMFVFKELQPEVGRIKREKYKKQELKEIMEAFAQITASAHLRMAGSPGCATASDLKDFFEREKVVDEVTDLGKKYYKVVKEDWKAFVADK